MPQDPQIRTPAPSALTTLTSKTPTSQSSTTHQVLHNLQHQHLWTSLQIHEPPSKFPISLISGIPPHRVYTHPDEQLYMVDRGLREEDVELDRVFVVPTVQGQAWSLERMSGVFDALPDPKDVEVEEKEQAEVEVEADGEGKEGAGVDSEKAAKLAEYYAYRAKARQTGEWGGKRLLLAMIDKGTGGEGTVVYYVVQEGTVKPRQN